MMLDTACLDEMYTSLAFSLPKSSCLAGCTKSRTGWSWAEWVRYSSQRLGRHIEKASLSGFINEVFKDLCTGTLVLFPLSVQRPSAGFGLAQQLSKNNPFDRHQTRQQTNSSTARSPPKQETHFYPTNATDGDSNASEKRTFPYSICFIKSPSRC